MKKRVIALIGIGMLVFSYFLVGCTKNTSPYPEAGRNTVELFGDGRFEIFSSGNEDGTRNYCLYDRKEEIWDSLECNISNYKEIAPCVYVIGTKGSGITVYDDVDFYAINEHGLSYCTIKGSFSVQNPLK